ncbi:MAG: single-stranded-DNA-specific exonuclease RecJ [Clostridia bacterium]
MNRIYMRYPERCDDALTNAISQSQHVSRLTARALIRRGIKSAADADIFLHPNISQLHDPFALPDLERATTRIHAAIQRKETICVYGDYDADGITASAILIRNIRALGGQVIPYIPSRHNEGYGLNAQAIQLLAREYVKLIITVDNGINAFDEIAMCSLLGMDVIVTDHHSAGIRIPECCAVVCATRKDATYPNPALCGAGVALKLTMALLPDADHRGDLALAAVATVADVMPLIGENRAIVSCGTPFITLQVGLRAILASAGWNEQTAVTGQTISFLIAPRLNAAGRIADAMRGVELLLCTDDKRAEELAGQLDKDNTMRKTVEMEILAQARECIDTNKRALLACHNGWNPGVIGIVASRLCEQYHLPTILFTEQDGVLTGSGRCPEGVDLYRTLNGLSKYFVRFGGHARAAGITMLAENFELFCTDFYRVMAEVDPNCFMPSIAYEEKLQLRELTAKSIGELEILSPFGEGNPEPAYLFEGITFEQVKRMGKDGAHLSAYVTQDGASVRMVAFRQGTLYEQMTIDSRMDLVAKPGINRFHNKDSVELYFVGANPDDKKTKLFNAIIQDYLYNGFCTDDRLAEWYLYVQPLTQDIGTRPQFCARYSEWRTILTETPVSVDTLTERYTLYMLTALLVFVELGFFVPNLATNSIMLPEQIHPRDLSESHLFGFAQRSGLTPSND